MREKEISIGIVVKFSSIVTLNKPNRKIEVCMHILLKVKKNCVNIGFGTQRKIPYVVKIIIKNNNIVFKTRDTRNWRCP